MSAFFYTFRQLSSNFNSIILFLLLHTLHRPTLLLSS